MLWKLIAAFLKQHAIAVTAGAAAVLVAGGAVTAVTAGMRRRQAAAEALATTTTFSVTADTTTATTTTTSAPATTTTTTAAATSTTKKKTTTTRRTTRRTVAPPPIVVEPENVKDDTAKKPDESVQKPTAADGVSLQYLREKLGGKGHIIGVDVSRHQNAIDWPKVKAAGITFAIIRCGYRTTVGGIVYEDANFQTNIQGALDAGIQVGIYFFSAAKTEQEALEEAAFVVKVLAPYRQRITWPVAYDFEIFDQDRLKGVSYTTITDNAMAFMDTIADAGYTPMVYSSRNMLWHKFETARLSAYRVWLAQYVNLLEQKRYNGSHVIWQCASDGRVDGIKGNVDLNIAYENLATVSSPLLPPLDLSRLPTSFSGFTFISCCEEVEVNTEGLNLRTSPYTDQPNKWITLAKGTRLIRTGIDAKNGWSRLEYRGITLYADTKYLKFLRTTQTASPTTTTTTDPTTTTTTEPTDPITTPDPDISVSTTTTEPTDPTTAPSDEEKENVSDENRMP